MKKDSISPNARKAFQNYKEELALELGINDVTTKTLTKDIVDRAKDITTNLGRS